MTLHYPTHKDRYSSNELNFMSHRFERCVVMQLQNSSVSLHIHLQHNPTPTNTSRKDKRTKQIHIFTDLCIHLIPVSHNYHISISRRVSQPPYGLSLARDSRHKRGLFEPRAFRLAPCMHFLAHFPDAISRRAYATREMLRKKSMGDGVVGRCAGHCVMQLRAGRGHECWRVSCR